MSKDVDFWKNQMLPFLIRFYNECMLPEILDSRHNRHMPIRNPKYIMEAKKEACRKKFVNKTMQKIKTSATEQTKCFSIEVSTNVTAVAALDIEKDDDCIIVIYQVINKI